MHPKRKPNSRHHHKDHSLPPTSPNQCIETDDSINQSYNTKLSCTFILYLEFLARKNRKALNPTTDHRNFQPKPGDEARNLWICWSILTSLPASTNEILLFSSFLGGRTSFPTQWLKTTNHEHITCEMTSCGDRNISTVQFMYWKSNGNYQEICYILNHYV